MRRTVAAVASTGVAAGRVVAAVLVLVALAVAPAGAHQGTPGLEDVIDAVAPAMPGVTVQIVSTVSDEVVVDNPTATVLTVNAFDGQPFLQIGPHGVLANLNSPTWAASNTPAGVSPRPSVGPPTWARVSGDHSWAWFDPRLPSLDQPPANGARPGAPVTVSSFAIPMVYGSTPVQVRGHLQYQPVSGAVVARLLAAPAPASGLTLSVLPGGPAPALYASWAGSTPAEIRGMAGEPFLRFGPFGVQANLASPTWIRLAQAVGHYTPGTTWAPVSTVARMAWIDPRALYGPGIPPADVQARTAPTDLLQWTLPVVYGRHTSSVAGVTEWVPDRPAALPAAPAAGAGHTRGSVAPAAIVAVVLLLGVLLGLAAAIGPGGGARAAGWER